MAKSVTRPPSKVKVSKSDFPLSCPPKNAKWNLHPRIYLPVLPGATEVICSYCSTKYIIADDKKSENPES